MKQKQLINNYILYVFTFLIFIFDLITPLGIASGTPYGLAVCLTLWSKKRNSTYHVALLSIVLTILGYYFSPEILVHLYVVIINRILAVVIVITSLVFVIQQKKLYKHIKELKILSTTDPLTHVGNRLAFNEQLESELSRYKRYERPLTIALVDIDNLKFINDDYGHLEGDEALRIVTQFIVNNIRDSDQFYRIGGDEFAILFVETSLRESVVISKMLRAGVENIKISLNYPLTISLGVAELVQNETQKHWLNRADTELYKAKKSGKNRVSYKAPSLIVA